MEIHLPHFVEYDITGHPTVSALANSLLANERLAQEAALLLEAFIPGLAVEATNVAVRRVAQESPLQQAFVVAIVAAFQPKLERDVPAIITDLTGYNVPEQYRTLITILVLMIAIYGVNRVIELLLPGKKKSELDQTYKSLTVVAGDLLQLTPDSVDAGVRARFVGKRPNQVASFIRGFFAPTEGRPGSRILAETGVGIEPTALAEIPPSILPDVSEAGEETESQFENNVLIVIHAMDRDHGKRGWAGHIPALFQDRLPIRLDRSIDPTELFTKTEITGDVLIVYKIVETGERIPTEIHLLRIKDAPKPKRRKSIR